MKLVVSDPHDGNFEKTYTVTGGFGGVKLKGVCPMAAEMYSIGASFNHFITNEAAFDLGKALIEASGLEVPAAPAVIDPMPVVRKRPRGDQGYKGNGKHAWEKVVSHPASVDRLRVPGGWLYANNFATPRTLVFVPVPAVVGYAI